MDGTADFQHTSNLKKYYGKYPGVVLKNDAQEGGHRGELMVEVYGVLEESPDGKGQRPIQVIAKPCFPPGFFFIPEVKDNVWVEFAAGDINTPIWIGVWYPKDKTPRDAENNAPTRFQKVIRTASGHVIKLDDSEGGEKIIITHKKKSQIEIDNEGNITITDKGGNTTILSQKITLDSNKIFLGHEEYEPLAKGNKLVDALKEIIDDIKVVILSHNHLTGMGPSGPGALLPPGDIKLQKTSGDLDLGIILSKKSNTG